MAWRPIRHLRALVVAACCVLLQAETTTNTADAAEAVVNPNCLALLRLQADTEWPICGSFTNFTAAVLSCVEGVNASQTLRPLRLLASNNQHAPSDTATLVRLLNRFKATTGFDVAMDMVPADEVIARALVNRSYDGWIADYRGLVDMAQAGILEPMDSYITNNLVDNWADIHPYYQEASKYNGTTMGIPVTGKPDILFYRADVFAKAGLQPPNTWDDFLAVAQVLNGSDFNGDQEGDYSLCFQFSEGCFQRYTAFSEILASMTQTQGLESGWLFDPGNMAPLINNQAALKTLALLAETAKYKWPPASLNDDCWASASRFLRGQCALAIASDSLFKALQRNSSTMGISGFVNLTGGAVGYVLLPGSAQVLDRATGMLVECTAALCPHATRSIINFNGVTQLVNRAPEAAFIGYMGMVNSMGSPNYKLATYSFFSFLSRKDVSFDTMLRSSYVGPFRTSHMSTDNTSLQLWQNVGFTVSDVQAYLTTYSTTLANKNIARDLRITNQAMYRQHIEAAVAALLNGASPSDVMLTLAANFNSTLQLSSSQLVQSGYRAGLGLQQANLQTPPQGLGSSRSSTVTKGVLAGVVTASIIVFFVLLLLLGYIYLRRRMARKGFTGVWSKAPGVSHMATLMVTDIEDSTSLWEVLPQAAMNKAVDLHHALARSLLRKHNGYESATEGDSFILAFHKPAAALAYAQAFQAGLLVQNWPDELLEMAVGQAVWAALAPHTAEKLNNSLAPVSASELLCISSDVGQPHSTPLLGKTGPIPNPIKSLTSRILEINSEGSWRPISKEQTVTHPHTPGPTHALSFFKAQWVQVMSDHSTRLSRKAVLVSRGLRVRVGIHTGIYEQADAAVNKTTGRTQYSGIPMRTAKAVGDCGHGGMVLLSQAAFEGIPPEELNSFGLLMNMGDYRFNKDSDLPPTPIYQAVARGMKHRLAFLEPKLRGTEQLQAGVLDAPLGNVTIAFANVVGVSTLLAWDRPLAEAALATFHQHAVTLLQACQPISSTACVDGSLHEGGYLIELADGLCLAAFSTPAAAMLWGVQLINAMKSANWSEDLLAHELCEPIYVGSAGPEHQSNVSPSRSSFQLASAACRRVSLVGNSHGASALFNGPRMKIGIDLGHVHADVNPTTGRMSYRGRVLNRASRISAKASSGSVWTSQECFDAAWEGHAAELTAAGMRATSMGECALKGINQPLNLVCITCNPPLSTQHHSRAASVAMYRASLDAVLHTSGDVRKSLLMRRKASEGPTVSCDSSMVKLSSVFDMGQPEEDAHTSWQAAVVKSLLSLQAKQASHESLLGKKSRRASACAPPTNYAGFFDPSGSHNWDMQPPSTLLQRALTVCSADESEPSHIKGVHTSPSALTEISCGHMTSLPSARPQFTQPLANPWLLAAQTPALPKCQPSAPSSFALHGQPFAAVSQEIQRGRSVTWTMGLPRLPSTVGLEDSQASTPTY